MLQVVYSVVLTEDRYVLDSHEISLYVVPVRRLI